MPSPYISDSRAHSNVVSLDPSNNGKALLLTSGTEVSIAPKTRSKPNGVGTKTAKDVKSEKMEPGGKDTEALHRRSHTLRVLPPYILSSFRPSCSALQDGSITAIGLVSRVLMNQVAEQPLYARPRPWRATVQRIPSPVNPTQDSTAPAPPVPTPSRPRVLVPHEKTTSQAAPSVVTDEPPQEEVLIAWSPEVSVPDGHVIFHGSVSPVEHWDHVK